jgi:signal transduction histidine kinase
MNPSDAKPAAPYLGLVPEDPSSGNELARDLAISRIAPGLAHEVANPLSAICGFAQLMVEDPGRSADDQEALGHILDSARRCLRLMEAYQKLARHAPPARASTIDLGACVEDAVMLLKGQWRLRPMLNVRVVRTGGIAHAAAPVTAVVHAVVQLLEGAVELLDDEQARLEVSAVPRGGGALVSIDGSNGALLTPDLVPEGLRVARSVLSQFGGVVEWCAAGGQMHIEAWIPSESPE